MMSKAMENLEITSPCYARRAIEDKNALREMPLCGKLNIRGDAGNEKFAAAMERATGVPLPLDANTSQQQQSSRLFWLGPDEWLLHCALDQVDDISRTLEVQLQGLHCAVTEISDYYTVLRLRGPDAGTLLRKGCPLDLHPSKFKPDDIAQSRFGHASILLHKLDDGESWDIQVRWTYAEYLWDYLVSAMTTLP